VVSYEHLAYSYDSVFSASVVLPSSRQAVFLYQIRQDDAEQAVSDNQGVVVSLVVVDTP
jgi:hypothetical protein